MWRHLIRRNFTTQIAPKITKEPITRLGKHLRDSIKIAGPLSLYSFMRQCLTNPLAGYYMRNQDVLGAKGDFITSPEISQMFGELIALWFVTQWNSDNQPKNIHLIECGPGKGTLLSDFLRTMKNFPQLYQSIKQISLIEAGEKLKLLQKQSLNNHSLPINWYDNLDQVPNNGYTMLIAHEFFDALPIHKFQLTENGWKEIFIDIDESEESPYHFKYLLSSSDTLSSKLIIPQYLSESNGDFKIGDNLEISPETFTLTKLISKRIHDNGGSSLIIDYGKDEPIKNSFRGIKSHQFISPLSMVGESDVTADVDFSIIKRSSKELTKVYGIINQKKFLEEMGIHQRYKSLLDNCKNNHERLLLKDGYERLIDLKGMGNLYKFLALTNLNDSNVPIGFNQ